MTLFPYLELQPIDPQDDGTISELDQFEADEPFDLTQEVDGALLAQEWDEIQQSMHGSINSQDKP